MLESQEFPYKLLYQTLCNTTLLQKKFKYFIDSYQSHNMHWIYQTICTFQKILTSPKQLPIIKFNTLLAIKYCFDTCQYTLITLIEVYLLPKITQIALFRSKIKDQTLLATYFTTQGYRESDHQDLKKISFNYCMLAIQFIFVSSMIKKYRTVENLEIKQSSKFVMNSQLLLQKGIKKPQKFYFFLPDYIKENHAKYLNKLKQFANQQICQIYSQYFLSIMINQIQTGKKSPLQIRSILSYGDAYLTSAMINLCQDQLNSLPENIQIKKRYLGLFYEFVRWGDIEAVLMINNSDFVTNISVNICNIRGDINISQGENIYPELQGKKQEKREFYSDFLKCIQTWAQCIPLNQEGLQSNVRRIYIFLKQQKKFKFPQNLILKRYQKQLQDNLKKNDQRNKKLLQIINGLSQEQQQSQIEPTQKNQASKITKTKKSTISPTKPTSKKKSPQPTSTKKPKKITNQQIQQKIENISSILQQLVSLQKYKKQQKTQKNFIARIEKLLNEELLKFQKFQQQWLEWLQTIDLENQNQMDQQEEQRLQEIVLNGEECIEAINLVSPLIQMYVKQKKINFQEMMKRIKKNLEIHQDLTLSRSKNNMDYSKKSDNNNIAMSKHSNLKKSLTNTIHKSILNLSAHKILSQSKFNNNLQNTNNQNHQANKMGASIYNSKNLSNSTSSILRKSKLLSKFNNKIKPQSSQIGKMIQSKNKYLEKISQSILRENLVHMQPFKHIQSEKQMNHYFQQHKSNIKSKQEIKEEEMSSNGQRNSHNSNSSYGNNLDSMRQKESKSKSKKQNSLFLKSSSNKQLKLTNNLPNNNLKQSRQSQVISSPSSSKHVRSQKNITIVSRNTEHPLQILQQQSKKVVADMNLSNDVNNVVVEYSDIDEKQFEEKAHEREKKLIKKNKFQNQLNERKKQEEKKKQEQRKKLEQAKKNNLVNKKTNQKVYQSKTSLVSESQNQNSKSNNRLQSPNYQVSRHQQIKIKSQSHIKQPLVCQNLPTKQKFTQQSHKNNRLTQLAPLNQDYGGKVSRIKQFDSIKTPQRKKQEYNNNRSSKNRQESHEKLDKTKKSQSNISIDNNNNQEHNTSLDKSQRSSVSSSKSFRQKLSQRINSQRKSILKKDSRSLQSQIRQIRQNQARSQSSQHKSIDSRTKKQIKSQTLIEKNKNNGKINEQYNYLPRKLTTAINSSKIEESHDLDKTKKVSQISNSQEIENKNIRKKQEQKEIIRKDEKASHQIQNRQNQLLKQQREREKSKQIIASNRQNNLSSGIQTQLRSQDSKSKHKKHGISLSLGKKSQTVPNTPKIHNQPPPVNQQNLHKFQIQAPRYQQNQQPKDIKFREQYFYQPNLPNKNNRQHPTQQNYKHSSFTKARQPQSQSQSEQQFNQLKKSRDSNNSKQSNRSRIRLKLNSRKRNQQKSKNNSDASSVSSFDIINSPTHKPLLESHYPNKQLQQYNKRKLHSNNKEGQEVNFKTFIQGDIKKQIICPRTKEIQDIIKYGTNNREIIKNLVKNDSRNSNNFFTNVNNGTNLSRNTKSLQKEKQFYSNNSLSKNKNSMLGGENSLNKSKLSREKYQQIIQLQDKLKSLEKQSRNMKTKLAVRDQQVKAFKNTSSKGFVQFSTPSESPSNYYTSTDGFRLNNKQSKITSDKGLLSPKVNYLSTNKTYKNQYQNNPSTSSVLPHNIKHIKSTPYRQYFQKIKSSSTTFKKTLLKSKSLIQKCQQIQIGCMTSRKQDFNLQVTIFITPLRFDLSDVNYSIINDQNLSIQMYPKCNSNSKGLIIQTKKQQKIHLNIKIKKIPFSVPQFEFSYKSKNQYSTNYFRLALPILFNKFCRFQESNVEDLERLEVYQMMKMGKNGSNNSQPILMTSEFKLNTKVIKLQKIKQILPTFNILKPNKDLSVLISHCSYKDTNFLIFIKINQNNHVIIQGIQQEENKNSKYLQFLMITLKNVFQS